MKQVFLYPAGSVPRAVLTVLIFALSVITVLPAQTNVLTYHNNNARTGANLTETILTPANIGPSSFGKLWSFRADGWVDAQPLYVSNLVIPGHGTHNVLYVATENDSVYALDAKTAAVLWHVSLAPAGETASDDRGCAQISPVMGITSTPAIFLNATKSGGLLYIVAMTKDNTGQYHQRLHAISLVSGAEQPGSPVEITGTYPSVGVNSSNGVVTFDPASYKSRPAVLLLNGVVYVSFSSNCDLPPYNGWIMAYAGSGLQQLSVLNVTANGQAGALWGGGGGPAADANGNIYLMVANGTFDPQLDASGFPHRGDFGNSFLKLAFHENKLSVADYFAPYNAADGPFSEDIEIGSSSPIVLPSMTDAGGQVRQLAIGCGKPGTIMVVDRNNMGKYNPAGDTGIYQELPQALGPGGDGNLAGALRFPPAFYNGAVYFGANLEPIKAFQFTNALLSATPVSQTTQSFSYPGVGLSISANGTSNGILWAAAGGATVGGLLAYAPGNLAKELYNSKKAPNNRDQVNYIKFAPPTIANGMVYVATQTGVSAFGLLH